MYLLNYGEAFVVNFTVDIYGLNTICPLFLRFMLRIIIFIVRFCMFHLVRSSVGKMFVDNNIPNFEVLLRKEVFSFTSSLTVSTNSIIREI